MTDPYNCIVVLGPTASGKTRLACRLAYALEGEIISADSRQVYKYLDIGTGKDLAEYTINGKKIPYHLIDCIEPGEQFYLHQFTEGLKEAFTEITAAKKLPVICGGTGLYLDALKKDFSFTQIKENMALRKELEGLTKEELLSRLSEYPETYSAHVDLASKKRLIRGIEIADYFTKSGRALVRTELPYRPYYIGVKTEINERKKNISLRLKTRINEGLITEVEALLEKGLSHERLELFGLEYKFVSRYLKHEITKDELVEKLQTAIFQFAKRQMTWFRKMEKEGTVIHWIEKDHTEALLSELKEKFNR